MTSKELMEILASDEFQHDLEEISSYLATTAQEGAIVHAIAKCLWKKGHQCALEEQNSDLFVIDRARVEFKFNYDTCMVGLEKELTRHGEDLRSYSQGTKKNGWGNLYRLLKDLYNKKPEPDFFVWIICSRDLTGRKNLNYIKRSTEWQKLWDSKHPYDPNGEFLKVADSFLEKARSQSARRFSILKEKVTTNGDFRSTYHFRICEFAKPRETLK